MGKVLFNLKTSNYKPNSSELHEALNPRWDKDPSDLKAILMTFEELEIIQGYMYKVSQFDINIYTRGKKEIHPYYLRPIEMSSIWMEIKYIKSATRLLGRDWVNKGGLDISKEVL